MTLEALYRRSLIVVALLALCMAALAGYRLYAWGSATSLGVLIASASLAAAAFIARRGRVWRPLSVLAIGSGFCAAAALSLVPWWVAVPAGLGLLSFALLVPAMFRRDRLAAALASFLAAAVGVQAACAMDVAAHPPRATLEDFEVEAPQVSELSDAYWRGRHDAERDLAAGRWRLLTYGPLPVLPSSSFQDALRRDGIELEAVAGCDVTRELAEHVRGYNEVMEAAIGKLLGPNYLGRGCRGFRNVFAQAQSAGLSPTRCLF